MARDRKRDTTEASISANVELWPRDLLQMGQNSLQLGADCERPNDWWILFRSPIHFADFFSWFLSFYSIFDSALLLSWSNSLFSLNFSFKCHRRENKAVGNQPAAKTQLYSVNAISFHPLHGTFSSAGSDGTINFWDKDSKTRLKSEYSIWYSYLQWGEMC